MNMRPSARNLSASIQDLSGDPAEQKKAPRESSRGAFFAKCGHGSSWKPITDLEEEEEEVHRSPQ